MMPYPNDPDKSEDCVLNFMDLFNKLFQDVAEKAVCQYFHL